MKSIFIFSIFVSLAIITGSCSQKRAVSSIVKEIDGDTVVPRDANSIYIHDFTDNSGIVADVLVLKIKEEINLDGRLTVVDNVKEADLRLNGRIKSYTVQNIQYGDMGRPIRKRLRIFASVQLHNLKKQTLIFNEPAIQAFQEFSDVITPIETEVFVKDKVIRNLAKRISKKIISGWYTEFMTPIEKGIRK